MIDASGSQRNVLDMEKEVGAAFLKQILTDKDMAYVISFDVTVDLLQDFTRDVHRLQAALNKARSIPFYECNAAARRRWRAGSHPQSGWDAAFRCGLSFCA